MSSEKLAFQARRLQPFAPLFYAAALIWEYLPDLNWAGFYRAAGEELIPRVRQGL